MLLLTFRSLIQQNARQINKEPPFLDLAAGGDRGMRILNRPLIAIWLTIVVCSGIALTVFEDGPFIVSAISLIIGLQALVSELLGVVVNSEGIWFPIRLSLGLPLMTLWRGRILENRFDRIDRAGPKSIVISGSGEEVIVDLSTHEHQKSFLRYASHVFPRKNVS